jgi:hypothetical protein
MLACTRKNGDLGSKQACLPNMERWEMTRLMVEDRI